MTNPDQVLEIEWQGIIGRLPDGFFLQVERGLLVLCYLGEGFERILEPGGQRPQGAYTRVCYLNISNVSAPGRAGIKIKIRQEVRRVLTQTGRIPEGRVSSET